jgi:iron complex transport system ATP-binding protein
VIGLGRIAIADDLMRDAIIRHAARLSSCEHLLHRSFDTLSGGEKARVHLARVFAQLWDEQNSLILVDEPLASLDPGLQIELLERMKRYADARNHAIVAILHDINQAMHHFDRLILVKDGKMVGDHTSGVTAIPDLADLYQIQLDAIERDGLPPWVFPRASLGLNTL